MLSKILNKDITLESDCISNETFGPKSFVYFYPKHVNGYKGGKVHKLSKEDKEILKEVYYSIKRDFKTKIHEWEEGKPYRLEIRVKYFKGRNWNQ